MKILSADVYQGCGPTLAAEYLYEKHGREASQETVRPWMIHSQLWRANEPKVKAVHLWRPRRSRLGELVQWDTSEHDWLEGRKRESVPDRPQRRHQRNDTTEENRKLLESYLEKFGRPLAFYTDKPSIFRTAEKRKRDDPGVDKDPGEMAPTQMGRALLELGIPWIAAHSSQAKGRVGNFGTAKRSAGERHAYSPSEDHRTANPYLDHDLVWWERELTVEPANSDDADLALDQSHHLAASLSHVETRPVRNDYTFPLDADFYQIERQSIVSGLRRAHVGVEKRRDGSVAVSLGERYLPVSLCAVAEKTKASPVKPARSRRPRTRQQGSEWRKNFNWKKGPKIWQVAQHSDYNSSTPMDS